MAAVTFHVDNKNFESNFSGYRGPRNEDYYEGEFTIKPSNEVSVKIESSLGGDFKIYRMQSNADLLFRRGWQHIRSDRTDVAVLWFVLKGRIKITDSAGTQRLFGKSAQGFRFGVKCDSRFGCGPKRAAAGLPISSARRSAIPVI